MSTILVTGAAKGLGKAIYEALEKENHEEHNHEMEEDEHKLTFRMVEVITGLKDDGYTEIHLIDSLPGDTKIVLNAAYYLLADMKKEETEHDH